MLTGIKSKSRNSIDVVKKSMNEKCIVLDLVGLCCFLDIDAAGVVFITIPWTGF